MLIDLKTAIEKYNLHIKGVVQCGAHWAEEHDIYVGLGINNIVYIEPCKNAFNVLLQKFNSASEYLTEKVFITLCNCACADVEGYAEMFSSSNNQGQSNSILKPYLHLEQHPEVVFEEKEMVEVRKLDNLGIPISYNLLVLDTQGSEGLILKGATETLKHIDCIYTEINRDYTYENNMLLDEMEEYLKPFGFVLKEVYWPSPSWSWGDGIFCKEK